MSDTATAPTSPAQTPREVLRGSTTKADETEPAPAQAQLATA